MKKDILIVALSFVTVLSISFGLYQKNQAYQYKIKALENEVLAKEMAIESEKLIKQAGQQRILAKRNAMEARRQEKIALENERKKY